MFFGEDKREHKDSDPSYYIWLQIKHSAKFRKMPFNLLPEDIVIPEYCPILGTRLVFGKGGRGRKNTPSVDRVDNSKGYVRGNIRVISFEANRLKDANTIETLERLLAYMKGQI